MISIDLWLRERREREPSVKVSVAIWLERYPNEKPAKTEKVRRKVIPKKLSAYLPDEMLAEVQVDANRHGRSLTQSLQVAWELSRDQIKAYPSARRGT